jgi:hypothetical protein
MSTRKRVGAQAVLACALLVAGCSGQPAATADSKRDQGLRLVPDPATTTAELAAIVEVPGQDPTRCRFTWRRGDEVIALASSSALAPSEFRKGDLVSVEVMLPAAAGGGSRTLRAQTRVANSPPVVRTVRIVAEAAGGGAALTASAECWDPDGDSPRPVYRWFRNGKLVPEASGTSFPALDLVQGDRVEVEVVAEDGEGRSEPRRSEPFQLSNRAPRFAAEAPAISSADGVVRVQAMVTDPDGDPLRFELVEAPSGMSIDERGAIRWPLPPREGRPGAVRVVVRAYDPHGGIATQEFTVQLGSR